VRSILVGVSGIDLEGNVILPAQLFGFLPGGFGVWKKKPDEGARDEALPGRGRPVVRPGSR